MNNSETITNQHGKEYLTNVIYLQKEDRSLFMIWKYYDSVTINHQKILNLLDDTPN